jgi:hypothetical protein
MTMSTFDLAIAFGVVALMPWVIWANYRNREGGLSGYLWREHPMLVRAALAFLPQSPRGVRAHRGSMGPTRLRSLPTEYA